MINYHIIKSQPQVQRIFRVTNFHVEIPRSPEFFLFLSKDKWSSACKIFCLEQKFLRIIIRIFFMLSCEDKNYKELQR